MFVLTESGRVVSFSKSGFKEYVNGEWLSTKSSALPPLSGEDFINGKVLSEEELSQTLKSGR